MKTQHDYWKEDHDRIMAEMNKPSGRFVPYTLHHKSGLMIQDYMWWHANEREILNWMAEHLPQGIEHQQGMTVTFDTDRDQMLFLLRWS